MFPGCKDYLSLIVNMLEHKGSPNLKNEVRLSLVKFFGEHPEAFKRFYQKAVQNVEVILRPEFVSGEKPKLNKDFKIRMMEVCNNRNSNFVKT